MNIAQAIEALATHLNDPPWLVSISPGLHEGKPAIILYTTIPHKDANKLVQNGWKSFPVLLKRVGRIENSSASLAFT